MSLEVNNFIDYFVICGLDIKNGLEPEPNEAYYEENGVSKPPLERSYKSKILNHFPNNLPWNQFDEDAVTQLCLPKGLMFQKHSSKANFHPFIITREDGSRVYGGAFTFYELIEDDSICNAMQTLQTMYDAEYSSSKANLSTTTTTSQSATLMNVTTSSSTNSTNSRFNSRSLSAFVESTNRNSIKKNTSNNDNTPVSIKTLANKQQQPVKAEEERLLINTSITINDSFIQSPPPNNKHNNYHHYTKGKDRLYATKSICLISQNAFNKSFRKILSTLHEMVDGTDLLGISLESHLYNLIYELPMPLFGKLMQFHIGCRSQVVHLPDYSNCNDLPLFDYDLLDLFQLIGVNNTLNLYISALLEHQILLYSKDYYLLMLIAESITTLFFPFVWLKPYVPIVPASNINFIDAPVPYIMGFHNKDIDKEFFKQGQRCFVDIDAGTVTCPEDLPDLPEKNKLIKEINDLILYFTEKRNRIKMNKLNTMTNGDHYCCGGKENAQQTSDVVQQQENNMKYEILQNSHAFTRISELARKANALNTSDIIFDHKNVRFNNKTQDSSMTSSGISSLTTPTNNNSNNNNSSSRSNNNNVINDKIPANNSLNSIDLSNQTDDSMNSTTNGDYSSLTIDEEDLLHLQFNKCIRELFLDRFVQMFVSYEKFVIVPNLQNNQIESWWMNREYSGNFDSKMFLIEQPVSRLPFLSHFIATQMFVSFIDLKIISLIDTHKSPDPNVKIFDERIKQLKETDPSNIFDLKANVLKSTIDVKILENDLHRKFCLIPVYAPTAHKIPKTSISNSSFDDIIQTNGSYLFENIDANVLKADEEFIKKTYNEMKQQMESKKQFQNHQIKLKMNKFRSQKDKRTRKSELSSRKSYDPTTKIGETTKTTSSNESNNNSNSELNPIFIQTLLKESKIKTKKMLVEKMPEAVNLGHGQAGISGIEENMLIASLCDLIERIWGHGLHSKPSKSSLWNHLTNYKKLIQYLHPNSHMTIDPKLTSPTLLWCLMKKKASPRLNRKILIDDNPDNNNNTKLRTSSRSITRINSTKRSESTTLPRKRLSIVDTSAGSINNTPNNNNNNNINNNITYSPQLIPFNRQQSSTSSNEVNNLHKRAQSVNSSNHSSENSNNQSYFPPLKNDLLGDLSKIDKLTTEVKTEIGMARAFVRLSLEKKLLADHLKQLLSEKELLRALYKKHAFLRQEDEREQFIYHLQSLNVVDYFCFTNHFKSISTDYSVLIVTNKRTHASTTSANAYIKLFGSLGESNVCVIPKHVVEFTIACNTNLGPLTTLVIGHDNAGMTPKWLIDHVFVRNQTTGHVHKFPCNRWLGKGVDDDSLERLLIAESINSNETNNYSHDIPSTIPTHLNGNNTNYINRSSSPSIHRTDEKKILAPAIQEKLGNSVNTLLKYFEKQDHQKGILTSLMCGDHGFVSSMENIFTFGFKSVKLFKRLYIWNFLEKISSELEGATSSFYVTKYEALNNIMNSSPSSNTPNHQNKVQKSYYADKLITAVKSINSISSSYGKDGKFQIFICLACRDSLLSEWFALISKSNTATHMYEEYSFLRNLELNKMCMKILSVTKQFNFKLESSLTMGIVI